MGYSLETPHRRHPRILPVRLDLRVSRRVARVAGAEASMTLREACIGSAILGVVVMLAVGNWMAACFSTAWGLAEWRRA